MSLVTSILLGLCVSASHASEPPHTEFHVDRQSWGVWAASQYPQDAEVLKVINSVPQVKWIGEWNPAGELEIVLREYLDSAQRANKLPVLAIYALPHRDCGSYSAGGHESEQNYRAWVDSLARVVGSQSVGIIIEPDGLVSADCLNTSLQNQRLGLIRYATQKLSSLPHTITYIDAGHSRWKSVDEITRLLHLAGVSSARGFSLNVSNFYTTAEQEEYGDKIAQRLEKHYVIDTSRNGLGPAPEYAENWCNPPGRALGALPTVETNSPYADAYLWVKRPGESDGTCNGGPTSGTWFHSWALDIIERSTVLKAEHPSPRRSLDPRQTIRGLVAEYLHHVWRWSR